MARPRKRLEPLGSGLVDADERRERLLGVFGEWEAVPERLKSRCSELDEQRRGLRREIAGESDDGEPFPVAAWKQSPNQGRDRSPRPWPQPTEKPPDRVIRRLLRLNPVTKAVLVRDLG